MPRSLLYFAAFTGMGSVFAATLLVAALVMSSISPATGRTPDPAAAGEPVAEGPIGEITIAAFDLGFEPASIAVPEAGTYTVGFVNDGGVFHDVTFDDGTVISADGHATATGEVTIPQGGIGFICSVPGHADGGMRGEVVVDAVGNGEPSHEGHERSAEKMREIDAARTAMFPAETEGRGNQVLDPEVLDDGTLQWELTASVIQWETEPGTIVEAYAYNEMVPGAQLRAEVGDRVRIVLHNELDEPTTIHFHGLLVPPEMDGVPVISQEAVLPGDSFVYEFEVRNAGSHMSHSHFMAEHQVPMGLLGAFIVSDPSASDEPKADIDYTTAPSASR